MGRPAIKRMASNGTMVLNRDGSNLAQYLLNIRAKDTGAFGGIVEAMRFVLDYARNIEPVETREIQPTMYLKMLEQMGDKSIEIPGWLISTGTIRILALLAVLRNPQPPPLIVVEEIENGLDPRTIHMVLDEIRTAVQGGQSQVILTTHSPYLLDLLPLQTLVVVERENGGNPVFWRPSDSGEIREWAERFAPGQLYTTGRLKREVES
jgi:predicted ATPase